MLGLWPIKPLDRSVSADFPVSPSRAPAFPVRLMFIFLRFYLIGNTDDGGWCLTRREGTLSPAVSVTWCGLWIPRFGQPEDRGREDVPQSGNSRYGVPHWRPPKWSRPDWSSGKGHRADGTARFRARIFGCATAPPAKRPFVREAHRPGSLSESWWFAADKCEETQHCCMVGELQTHQDAETKTEG